MVERDPSRIPVVVGAGQATNRDDVVDAVEMACRAARAAFTDAPGIESCVQRVSMVAVSFSPVSAHPASDAAARLGLPDARCEVTTPGGNSPQWLLNRAAADIAAGELAACLILGGEATNSMRARDGDASFLRAARSTAQAGPADAVVGPSLRGMMSPAEIAAKLTVPAIVYAMLEGARAHAAGRSPGEQRAHIAPLYARLSEVAAANPYAWFREKRSPQEIGEPTADNRLTAEPYTKRMNSFPHVDQGAALLVTSLERARNAGLADQCVFPWAGATTSEPPALARPSPGVSPALEAAARAAFEAAGVGIDDVAQLDLYSCFPSAVCAAADGLGLAIDDARGLTATGGMSFFGGPGNNYSGHGIAALTLRLRESGGLGVVTANGGYLSKHSVGIYGTGPPPRGFMVANTEAAQQRISAAALPVATSGSGRARVDAGTVVYARDGSVERAPVMARLATGERVVAEAEPACLQGLAGCSLVGREVELRGSPTTYRI